MGPYQPEEAPHLRMLPPRDMAEIHVVLRYNSTTPTELHYRPTLEYRGADKPDNQWEATGLLPTRANPSMNDGFFEWVLAVQPRMWDSPFAEHTRWDISVDWQGASAGTPPVMEGDFHFWIQAIRA